MDYCKNQYAFREAQEALNEYHILCEAGCARSKQAREYSKVWINFFNRYYIKNWTVGAVLLGCATYAKYLTDSGNCSIDELRNYFYNVGYCSALAEKLINGTVSPDDFLNRHNHIMNEEEM